MMKSWLTAGLILLLAQPQAFAKPAKARKPAAVERPPQYVLLAFDGSFANDFWDESVAFAETVPTTVPTIGDKKLMRFTYFVNPPYYVARERRSVYTTPGINKPGVSCIGWGNPIETIGPRVDRTNYAFQRGHEIGSHANSHCDASGKDKDNPMFGRMWTEADWNSEFEQFNRMFFNVYSINGIKPTTRSPNGFVFKPSDIVGFRAPLLEHTPGLWPTLKKFGFRYDTSKSSSPTYWPQRNDFGTWNFPLGMIKIAGSTRKTLSMDYNWLCFHSACATKKDLTEAERQQFKKQMVDSYMYYFKINYHGGRAPVHIGHHFSKWNKGAYWDAMKEFAQNVCSRPEVRCVTYKAYADWLDGLDAKTLQSYRDGDFAKLKDDGLIKDIAEPVMADVDLDRGDGAFEAVIPEKNKARMMGYRPELQVDFAPWKSNRVSREELSQVVKPGSNVTIRAALYNKAGSLINSSTYRIEKFGTPEESITDRPLEEKAMQGETADAHMMAD